MAQIRYSQVKLGQKIKYNNKIYTKVKPVKKSCCVVLYNSISVDDESIKITISPHTMIEIINE